MYLWGFLRGEGGGDPNHQAASPRSTLARDRLGDHIWRRPDILTGFYLSLSHPVLPQSWGPGMSSASAPFCRQGSGGGAANMGWAEQGKPSLPGSGPRRAAPCLRAARARAGLGTQPGWLRHPPRPPPALSPENRPFVGSGLDGQLTWPGHQLPAACSSRPWPWCDESGQPAGQPRAQPPPRGLPWSWQGFRERIGCCPVASRERITDPQQVQCEPLFPSLWGPGWRGQSISFLVSRDHWSLAYLCV